MIDTLRWVDGKIRIIDQRQLPKRLVYIDCKDVNKVVWAIKNMAIRGAPALGVCAAFGCFLGITNLKTKTYEKFERQLDKVIKRIKSCRPTAVNLFWGLDRMKKIAQANKKRPIERIKKMLFEEAKDIYKQDRATNKKLAYWGGRLIKNGDVILTHCNAGALATAGGYGTALGAIFYAREKGKKIKVYVDETRPILQGARLTAWELLQKKIDTTLICDNMAAVLMKQGIITKIFVGADRIARNADAANKIGTYNLAVLAKFHKIPFYVVAPLSSFDFSLKNGSQIPIEHRNPKEVTHWRGIQTAPKNVKVFNPAFDVTPNELITGIINEKGIFRAPYRRTLDKLWKKRKV